MRSIICAILMTTILSSCASAPKPKKPDVLDRVPINKTIPAEIQRGKYDTK
ncbi:TrwH protein [Bartonella sp. A05]|uniref:TrwH protein n=1 Tax=Bartonella sp. A05 TaxID=2967261 RepID=UPI0022A9B94A|nr:TrwH protein [Bartonella sp. A05]MCZ2203602.1 TrwH protein [Bartonella sp. A05]